jgi:hypothetical protein
MFRSLNKSSNSCCKRLLEGKLKLILNSSAIKKKNTIQDEDDNCAGRNLSSNITTSSSREMDHVPYFD